MNLLRYTRRDLAARFAKGTFAYLLASSLMPSRGRAAGRAMKRFVVIAVPEGGNVRLFSDEHVFGLLTDLWCPQGTGNDHPIGAWSPIMGVFDALKSDLLVVDGLWNPADKDRQFTNGPDGHYQSFITMITGNHTGQGTTLDQMLVPVLKGNRDYLRDSVQLGIANGDWNVSRKAGQGIAGYTDPADAFKKLFTGVTVAPAAPPPMTPAPAPKPAFTDTQARKLLTDLYLEEYKALRAMVGADEQRKLDFNVDALSDLRKRLLAADGAGGAVTRPAATKCDPSAANAAAGLKGMDKLAKPMMDVAAQVLACDLTRVLTIQMAHPYLQQQTYDWLGITEGHHTLSHRSPVAVPARQDQEVAIYKWYYQQIATFASTLKGIPDPDGGTVLDNTVILVVSEFGDGQHTWDHLPVFILGGRAAGVRGGRVLHFSPNVGNKVKSGDCQPINRLFMAIANELAGQNLTSYGDAQYCAGGALTGLV